MLGLAVVDVAPGPCHAVAGGAPPTAVRFTLDGGVHTEAGTGTLPFAAGGGGATGGLACAPAADVTMTIVDSVSVDNPRSTRPRNCLFLM
jgi:hypothetical protein